MGIRFERNNRKATNGPLIFFSIVKDEAFIEEIRGAYISGLSFYAYRYPGDSMMSYGSSEGYEEGIEIPGFFIGMFDPSKPFLTIPYKGTAKSETIPFQYSMPAASTSFDEYSNEVSEIVRQIKEGKGDKVVAARVIVEEKEVDIAEKFYQLCSRFPDAFVFCFSTPATGCWIGASPEILLKGHESTLSSMALAGTREAGSDTEWDAKNREEQRIVKDYILKCLSDSNLSPYEVDTFTLTAGPVEHICTEINAEISPDLNLQSLLKELSPTPALCGSPKNFALKTIEKLEKFDRGCYGGFCGPFHSLNDFTFNVVLRCSSVSEKKICTYVGGGITSDSKIEKEWQETELKAQKLISSENE